MDTLTIQGLKFHALHGLYEDEKRYGNDFEVDLILQMDLRNAGRSDKIIHTFDYVKAESKIQEIMNGESVNLIERLCLMIGEAIFKDETDIHELKVRVRKMSPPIETKIDFTQVEMSWQR